MAKLSLGKGLGALLKDTTIKNEQIVNIKIEEIIPNPYQPRKNYNAEKMDELVSSIEEHGILQPIVVRKNESGKYELIFGERRYRSVKKLGMKKIPAIVRKYTDIKAIELALIENLQRADLNPIEEAYAYEQLMKEFHLTHEQIAKKIGKTRSSVTNMLRILKLSDDIKVYIVQGVISVGHAKVILSVTDEQKQKQLAHEIVDQKLSVRAAEKRAEQLQKKHKKKALKYKNSFFVNTEKQLNTILKTKVKIKEKNAKGKIEIHFSNEKEFKKIIEQLS